MDVLEVNTLTYWRFIHWRTEGLYMDVLEVNTLTYWRFIHGCTGGLYMDVLEVSLLLANSFSWQIRKWYLFVTIITNKGPTLNRACPTITLP